MKYEKLQWRPLCASQQILIMFQGMRLLYQILISKFSIYHKIVCIYELTFLRLHYFKTFNNKLQIVHFYF